MDLSRLYLARGKVVIYYKYAKNTEVITFGNGEVNPLPQHFITTPTHHILWRVLRCP